MDDPAGHIPCFDLYNLYTGWLVNVPIILGSAEMFIIPSKPVFDHGTYNRGIQIPQTNR